MIRLSVDEQGIEKVRLLSCAFLLVLRVIYYFFISYGYRIVSILCLCSSIAL